MSAQVTPLLLPDQKDISSPPRPDSLVVLPSQSVRSNKNFLVHMEDALLIFQNWPCFLQTLYDIRNLTPKI